MIKQTKKSINLILEKLPDSAMVLDIGGASAPFKRANHIIDAVDYESINWDQAKGPGDVRFTKESYTQHDICSHVPWPFKDKQFDYSICSHVLEDIRDPLWVCHEIIRVSKAGYIEIPSRLYETTFNIEIKKLAGASHHRWVIDLVEDKNLCFTFKYMHIHTKAVNKNKGKYRKSDRNMYLCLEWSDSFEFHENWLNSGKEIFEYYLEKQIDEKEKWGIYRKVGSRNFVRKWLGYLKNTNSIFENLSRNIRKTN